MEEKQQQIQNALLLISRLERLSADSYWAHKASGLRGSLLRWMDRVNSPPTSGNHVIEPQEFEHLNRLLSAGFEILEKAAREIIAPEQE
jgi:hypothetical protein